MDRHTVGDWCILSEDDPDEYGGEQFYEIVSGHLGTSNFYCMAHVIAPDGSGRLNDESLANARLIAAAPDMLSTLRACAAAFRDYEMQHMNKDPPSFAKAATNRELAEACERVIRRATEGG